MIARAATQADIPWMLDQLKEFSAFMGTRYPLMPSCERATEKMADLIAQQPVFVAENGQGRKGFIIGLLAPHYFNPDIIVLTEILWWVAPEHRGSRAAAVLFQAYLEVGQRMAQWITFTVQEPSLINTGWLVRRGFRIQEHSYLLEV